MEPRITVLTLGVSDLERSLKFYRDGLGLPTEGIVGTEFEHGAVAFFDLQNGLKLAIWNRNDLAHDAKVALGAASATEITIGHNVRSKAEVDRVMEQAKQAGATITDTAQDRFWGGYSGYFQDPDGHLWEIVWNPDLVPQTEEAREMMLKKLTPNLMVEDVRKTLQFYHDVLGFETATTVEGDGETNFAIVHRDDVELMFQSRKSLSENVPALTGSAIGASQTFYIEVTGIDQLYQQLSGKVEIVVDMHNTFYGTREFYFRDVNGYILSFSETVPQ